MLHRLCSLQIFPICRTITFVISSIARGFKEFYLKNPTKRHDCDELNKSTHPEDFPLARVSTQ